MKVRESLTILFWVFILICLTPPAVFADDGPNHRVSSNFYGVSGGNVNHKSRAFCCGGTLGSLLQDSSGVLQGLSNNHVLARTDSASPGEDITQPGLIDNGCQSSEIVGDLSLYPNLGTNVDAATAALRSGAMSSGGEILDIGQISTNVLAPTVGLAVAKSGRTTGYTEASIAAIDASVSVQYQRGCNQGKKFIVSYTNQIVIESSSFSAGGDSGSLIVSGHSTSICRQPVGLLFAGSSTTTIANPAGEVLTKVGTALGKPVSFVGSTCTSGSGSVSAMARPTIDLAPESLDRARNVLTENLYELMRRPAVIGAGIGADETAPGEAAIVVLVDVETGLRRPLPETLDGVRVRIIYTDPIVAY